MPLLSIQEYCEKLFTPDSRPSHATVRRWIREGDLAGRRIGKKFFVDSAAVDSGGNPLVERILRDVARAS